MGDGALDFNPFGVLEVQDDDVEPTPVKETKRREKPTAKTVKKVEQVKEAKQQINKPSDSDRPARGGRGRGRGGRGRGRGRGGRGGRGGRRRRPENAQPAEGEEEPMTAPKRGRGGSKGRSERGRKNFDRRKPYDRDGRTRREGRGPFNEGALVDDSYNAEESSRPPRRPRHRRDVKPADEGAPVEEAKPVPPPEEEDKTITLDVYKKNLREQQLAEDRSRSLRKAGEGEDGSRFKESKQHEKKKEEDLFSNLLVSKKRGNKRSKKSKKKVIEVSVGPARPQRGGPRQKRNGASNKKLTLSSSDFPALA